MKHHSSPLLSKVLLAYRINILKAGIQIGLQFLPQDKKATNFTVKVCDCVLTFGSFWASKSSCGLELCQHQNHLRGVELCQHENHLRGWSSFWKKQIMVRAARWATVADHLSQLSVHLCVLCVFVSVRLCVCVSVRLCLCVLKWKQTLKHGSNLYFALNIETLVNYHDEQWVSQFDSLLNISQLYSLEKYL